MQIERVEDGYLLRKPGGEFCHLVRNYNGAESWACSAIDYLMTLRERNRELQDRTWYWVWYEGLDATYEAPAMYRADAKAFYSVEFSGVPASEVLVLNYA